MPAERTKVTSRRTTSDGTQSPVAPSAATADAGPMQSISFAPNLTPVTFNEPPPTVDPSESALFPPSPDCPSTRRQGHGQKKPENHIPRPPNAFILFRSSFIKNQHVSTEVETNHSTLSKIIGLTWQNLPHEARQVWHAKAKAALDEHKRRYPQYTFRPLHSKSKTHEKRKVREVGPKDLKRCEKIAELLVEGKKGTELDAAIKEFDATHVPEIVTRFEAPLTARMYRRGSSAPIPDTDKSTDGFTPSSPPQRPRKARAASSQPTRQTTPATPPPAKWAVSPAPTEMDSEMCHDALFLSSYAPSTTTYAFPPSESVHLDPNSFSFSQSLTPQPCADVPRPPSAYDMLSHGQSHSLSVDTSPPVIDTNWTVSSSPMSCSQPATPGEYSDIQSPCIDPMDPYAAYAHLAPYQTMPDLQLYAEAHSHPPRVCTGHQQQQQHYQAHQIDYASLFGKDSFLSFHETPTKPTMAHLDLEFTQFMASLPATAYQV